MARWRVAPPDTWPLALALAHWHSELWHSLALGYWLAAGRRRRGFGFGFGCSALSRSLCLRSTLYGHYAAATTKL